MPGPAHMQRGFTVFNLFRLLRYVSTCGVIFLALLENWLERYFTLVRSPRNSGLMGITSCGGTVEHCTKLDAT